MPLPYLPARLVATGRRWYVLYYQTDPLTGKRHRFREYAGLNRIKDTRERLQMANILIKQINTALPDGYPFIGDDNAGLTESPRVMAALSKVLEYKTRISDRPKTGQGLKSAIKVFGEWLQATGQIDVTCATMHTTIAQEFLAWLITDRQVSPTTRNNYMLRLRTLFNAIPNVLPGILDDNPFSGIKKLPETAATRRALTDTERRILVEHAQHDRPLMLAILLQYHCFIRPGEIRRLRFRYFDLKDGFVRLPGSITKNKRAASVQIPDVLMPYLIDYGFEKYSPTFYIFGKGGNPGREICSMNFLQKRHKKLIDHLVDSGLLDADPGIKFYSWKDTGVAELVRQKVNIREIQLQVRHTSLEVTQHYLASLGFQFSEIKALNNRLIDFNWRDVRQ